jgi:hypothetical protein
MYVCMSLCGSEKEFDGLYATANIIWVIKSRRMGLAGHVARMGKEWCIQGFGGEILEKETTWKTQA